MGFPSSSLAPAQEPVGLSGGHFESEPKSKTTQTRAETVGRSLISHTDAHRGGPPSSAESGWQAWYREEEEGEAAGAGPRRAAGTVVFLLILLSS